jgi:hypothetical protein
VWQTATVCLALRATSIGRQLGVDLG